jgi:hypothetical protein
MNHKFNTIPKFETKSLMYAPIVSSVGRSIGRSVFDHETVVRKPNEALDQAWDQEREPLSSHSE